MQACCSRIVRRRTVISRKLVRIREPAGSAPLKDRWVELKIEISLPGSRLGDLLSTGKRGTFSRLSGEVRLGIFLVHIVRPIHDV